MISLRVSAEKQTLKHLSSSMIDWNIETSSIRISYFDHGETIGVNSTNLSVELFLVLLDGSLRALIFWLKYIEKEAVLCFLFL